MGTTRSATLGRHDFDVVTVGGLFRRGDANDDGRLDISDPVMILGCKFLGEECPTCRDSGDANDDGNLDISDAVMLLQHLFSAPRPPGPPGPFRCGPDPTEDSIPPCDYTSC